MTGHGFPSCTACSDGVVRAYTENPREFLLQVRGAAPLLSDPVGAHLTHVVARYSMCRPTW